MMRIPLGNLPSMSTLFLDYVSDWDRVRRFYAHSYSFESIIEFARNRPRLDPTHLTRLCTALSEQQKQWGSRSQHVKRLAEGAVAVVTGQQPGLFTGPAYSILKAITAIKLAAMLDENGVPAVPVFWIAAEDHDHLEIQSTAILNRESQLHNISVDLSNGESSPVGWLTLPESIPAVISECLNTLPESEFHSQVRSILEDSYRPGLSPVDAFARMMSKLFEGSSLILANPLDPELKSLAAPTLRDAVRKNAEIRSAVLARNRALSQAGYHEQVKVDTNFTGLFAYRGKARQALRPDELSMDAMLSPSALLRPAVQDAIFPTAVFVGGPAEIAYFGQAAAVYETLGRPIPPVFPRISATIVEARVARVLRKYDIAFSEVLRGREFMKRKAVASVQGVEMFDAFRDRIVTELNLLRPAVTAVDPTLEGAIGTSQQKMLHQVETLRTKFINAEARRNETLERQLDTVTNSLFPEKKLQERVINVTSFLIRYGLNFAARLEGELNLDSREHQVIEI
jgi:uncharacterized protein YllA (UPF0747 family)